MPLVFPPSLVGLPVSSLVVVPESGSTGSTFGATNIAGQCAGILDSVGNLVPYRHNFDEASGNWGITNVTDCSKEQRFNLSQKSRTFKQVSTSAPEIIVDNADIQLARSFILLQLGLLTTAGGNLDSLFQTLRDLGSPGAAVVDDPILFGTDAPNWTKTRSGFRQVGAASGIVFDVPYPVISSKSFLRSTPDVCTPGLTGKMSLSFTATKKLPAPFCRPVTLYQASIKFTPNLSMYEDGDLTIMYNGAATNVYTYGDPLTDPVTVTI
jgi:hypothetical protein